MKNSIRAFSIAATSALLICGASAQTVEAPDTIVVFDGSGSMWGQISGRSKIEIARETLSTVLSEVPSEARIGMIAYGHRQKGVCSDIETVVPVGSANQSVPAMIDFAYKMKPKGKTPLSDAVRIAADELKFTENAATVILVTDGIETCNADPCALASELERTGVGFTAHVVGFDLSEEEGRQVQCLAENTGGLYLSANNADELGDALRRTVQAKAIAPSDDDFADPVAITRNVRFILRDTPNSEQIGIRQLNGNLQRADGTPIGDTNFKFAYPEANGNSATATLEPGNYVIALERNGGSNGGYSIDFEFEIPAGEGEHIVDASLSGALIINPFLNLNTAYDPKAPPRSAVRDKAWAYFSVFPVSDGQVAETPLVTAAYDNLNFPLASGDYLIRGNLDRTTSAEKFVKVNGVTEVNFSFDVTRVFVDARQSNGAPVERQTTYWYDKVPSGRNYWTSGGGVSDGEVAPFYLPTGQWVVNVGGEGYGKRRSEQLIAVSGDYQDMRLQIGEGTALDADDEGNLSSPTHQRCIEILKVKYNGCLVEKADIDVSPSASPSNDKEDVKQPASDAADLSDVRLNFGREANGKILAAISFPANDKGLASIALSAGWCGDVNACSGSIAGIPIGILSAFDSGKTETFIDNWDVGKVTVNPDGLRDTIDVIERGVTKRFVLINRLGQQTQLASKPQNKSDNSSVINGLSGTDFAFANNSGNVLLHVVRADGDTSNITIALEPEWCGVPACKGGRFDVDYDKVKHIFTDGFNARTIDVGGYTLDVSSFGSDKEINVSGEGTSRIRFTLFDEISLSGSRAAQQISSQPMSQDVSGDDFPIFGIFNLEGSGPVEDIVADFNHALACQRGPTVIYPDGSVVLKQFSRPKDNVENPFKTVGSGQCSHSNGRYICELRDSLSGQANVINFELQKLGNNHFQMNEDGKIKPIIAASCFYPGGDISAFEVMPNGRPLAELMMERDDNKAPGFSYDKDNKVLQ